MFVRFKMFVFYIRESEGDSGTDKSEPQSNLYSEV